jgi:hypothetical protein
LLLVAGAILALVAVIGVVAVIGPSKSALLAPEPPPLTLTGLPSTNGWLVTFQLPEEAYKIEYKRPVDADFLSTGFLPTGQAPVIPGSAPSGPRANTTVAIPDLHGSVPLLVRYTTLQGVEKGPFEVVFDVTTQAVAAVKRTLAFVPEWISFRSLDGRTLCYFTTLVAQKYAFKSVRYGIDTDAPDRDLYFVPSDVVAINSSDQLFIELPRGARFVTVELVFRDDSVEGPRRFLVP